MIAYIIQLEGGVGGAPEVNNLVYTKRQKHNYAYSTHETTYSSRSKFLKDYLNNVKWHGGDIDCRTYY